MARPFRWGKKGRLVARLSRQERHILVMMCDELAALLEEPASDADVPQWARDMGLSGLGESRSAPEDPVLARLLPDAYEDPGEAEEFRRLTETSLRATKLSNIAVVRADLDLDPTVITEHAQAWLAFLADCRLALGTRLGITDDDPMWPGRDPQKNLYLYLGYLQQELVETLMGE